MKKQDVIALIFALVLLVGVGYYFLSQNSHKTTAAGSGTQVEVAPVIPNQLDPRGTLDKLSSTYKVRDFKQAVNLTGLGNPAPFSGQ